MSSQPSKYVNNFIDTAVYQVMHDHFLPSEADDAVDLWQAKYAVKQLIGLVGFLDEVTQLFKLDQQRKQTLRMTLYRKISENKRMPQGSLSSPGDDSTVVAFSGKKEPVSVNKADDHIKEQAFNSPAFVVFSTVGNRLIEQVQKMGYDELRNFTAAMQGYLKKSSLPVHIAKSIVDWRYQESLAYEENFSEKYYASVIHMFYMALCETLGPVDADAMLNDAINQANTLPEAQSYPPKRFL